MSRPPSVYHYDPEMQQLNKPSACGKCIRFTWKTITFLFSHITLVSMVVSYCILGAITFQGLEADNELTVKKGIVKIRENYTEQLWNLTTMETAVLKEDEFTKAIIAKLKLFEADLLKAITKDGWDGDEDTKNVQWSLAGALFYSIIVITTIGYGHIAPKTTWGKVVTIFYALLGIPLMLLCLSNIGDIMATSFRFIYWKICCYVCTKKPKKPRRGRYTRGTIRQQGSRSGRSRTASIKRPARTSTRSADSAIASSSYSDPDLRYDDQQWRAHYKRGQSLPRMKLSQQENEFQEFEQDPRSRGTTRSQAAARGGSLDRRAHRPNRNNLIDPTVMSSIKIVTNRYVVDESELQGHLPGITYEERRQKFEPGKGKPRSPQKTQRERAEREPRRRYHEDEFESEDDVPNNRNTLDIPRDTSPASSSIRNDDRRKRKQNYSSPKIMSPFGYGHHTKYLDNPESDIDYYSDTSGYDQMRNHTKPVPIWLCVFLVISYIIAGTFLFSYWEGWEYLDSAYFCFITLTTIGFGDFVPAKRVKNEEFKKNIAFCSLYLLFGISLLAMSFNLVQEEVIANVKRVAKTLGIIKSEEEEFEDDEE